jgi:hypothetical protein
MHLILWLAGTEARYQKTVKQIIYTPNIWSKRLYSIIRLIQTIVFKRTDSAPAEPNT